MHPARPTLRTLVEDLELPIPPITTPLDQAEHPLLAKAAAQFADDGAKHERIRAIDDEVLFKAKVRRWRGAVWVDADIPWLIAAGQRAEGSPDDFTPTWKRGRRVLALDTTPYIIRRCVRTRT